MAQTPPQGPQFQPGTSGEEHEHTWTDAQLTDGRAIKQCTTCPRWKLAAPTRGWRR